MKALQAGPFLCLSCGITLVAEKVPGSKTPILYHQEKYFEANLDKMFSKDKCEFDGSRFLYPEVKLEEIKIQIKLARSL